MDIRSLVVPRFRKQPGALPLRSNSQSENCLKAPQFSWIRNTKDLNICCQKICPKMWHKATLICVFLVGLAVLCVAPPVRKGDKSDSKTDDVKGDPEYARYLKQVIEILESDDDYVKKLLNASEEELRTGKVADDLDLVKHDVRTKLDELKRQEVERQRMIRRQMNDHLNGLKEREYWNPLFDDENPNFFGPEDFKKLLWKVLIFCLSKNYLV